MTELSRNDGSLYRMGNRMDLRFCCDKTNNASSVRLAVSSVSPDIRLDSVLPLIDSFKKIVSYLISWLTVYLPAWRVGF